MPKSNATTTAVDEAAALDGEIKSMGAEVEALEGELGELDAPEKAPSWDDLRRAGVVEELEARERRRGVLPRIIGAAREKLLELRVNREEALLAPLKAERERAHVALEEALAEARRAEEERGAAAARWSVANANVQERERRVERAARELAELREGRR